MIVPLMLNPGEWYLKTQADNPLFYDEAYVHYFGKTGAWHVFRYKDIQTILGDTDNFSSAYIPSPEQNLFGSGLPFTDPPRHKKLRSLITGAFTPAAIAQYEPVIRQGGQLLIDAVKDRGTMDFVAEYGKKLPLSTIVAVLGITGESSDYLQQLNTGLLQNPALTGDADAHIRLQSALKAFFEDLLATPDFHKRNGLISHLMQAEIDGEKLSGNEILSFCIDLLFGGDVSTGNLITNTMYSLIEHPHLQEHLWQYPADLPQAINEVLRYRASFSMTNRMAKNAIEISGKRIKKGDVLNLWLASGNYDPEVFENPELFDINRPNHSSMLTFGHGIHYCIGSFLTKMEARITFELILQQFKNIRLQPGVKLEFSPSAIDYGIVSLPIIFDLR